MSCRAGSRFPNGQHRIAPSPALAAAPPALLLFTFCLILPATARAVDKASCVDAHASAQKWMKEARLRESKEQLALCADSSCPALVRQDCERWLGEVDRQLQPVTIEARDASGKVLMTVRGPLEMQAKTGTKAGTETRADPGPNEAPVPAGRATGEPQEPQEERDLRSAAGAAEGRTEAPTASGLLPPAEPPVLPPPAAPPDGAQGASPRDDAARAPAGKPRRSLPAAAWVTGFLTLASFGSAAVLGVTGALEARSLRETCAPNCQSSRVSAVRQDLVIADVSALAGVAFGAATVWMIWTHREAAAPDGRTPDPPRLSARITGRSFRLEYATSF